MSWQSESDLAQAGRILPSALLFFGVFAFLHLTLFHSEFLTGVASYVLHKLLKMRHLADYLSPRLCYPGKTVCKGLADIEGVAMEDFPRSRSKASFRHRGLPTFVTPPWLI